MTFPDDLRRGCILCSIFWGKLFVVAGAGLCCKSFSEKGLCFYGDFELRVVARMVPANLPPLSVEHPLLHGTFGPELQGCERIPGVTFMPDVLDWQGADFAQ